MTVYFISLGCDKNLVDSEQMLGMLTASGHTLTDDPGEAQVLIVNTCCFIHDAKEESIQTILELAAYKNEGSAQALIVTGCMAQRYQQEILDELPEVDAVIGTTAFDTIAEVIDAVTKGRRTLRIQPLNALPMPAEKRVITGGGFSSYLKIAEGCDKHCTYCIIPSLRGPYRSIPMEALMAQAAHLAQNGVRELNLVAQETTLYGVDLYGRKALPELLEKLCAIDGIDWIRVLYCYPEEITQELIDVMKREEKICHYLDMPVQHADDGILARMGRKTSRKALETLIKKLRSEIPDITLRTTLIAGFPGETDEAHETLLRFVRDMRFDRLGVFTYSAEEGTPAAGMPDQVEEAVKVRRQEALMQLQQEIASEKTAAMTDQILEVLIEGFLPDEEVYIGRTRRDAPDVDGYIFVTSGRPLMSGDIVDVWVTGSDTYDLTGEVIEDESAE